MDGHHEGGVYYARSGQGNRIARGARLFDIRDCTIKSGCQGRAGLQQADHEISISGQTIPVGGDIIVSIDGRQINGPDDVCSIFGQKQVGDNVRVGIDRDGILQQVNLILEEAPPGTSSEC